MTKILKPRIQHLEQAAQERGLKQKLKIAQEYVDWLSRNGPTDEGECHDVVRLITVNEDGQYKTELFPSPKKAVEDGEGYDSDAPLRIIQTDDQKELVHKKIKLTHAQEIQVTELTKIAQVQAIEARELTVERLMPLLEAATQERADFKGDTASFLYRVKLNNKVRLESEISKLTGVPIEEVDVKPSERPELTDEKPEDGSELTKEKQVDGSEATDDTPEDFDLGNDDDSDADDDDENVLSEGDDSDDDDDENVLSENDDSDDDIEEDMV